MFTSIFLWCLVFMVSRRHFFNVFFMAISFSAPTAPIFIVRSSFLRGSKAEIQGYRSAQKRAPSDHYMSSYDAIKFVPKFIFHKNHTSYPPSAAGDGRMRI